MANADSERDAGENRKLNRGLLVIPNRRGTDIDSADGKKDGHIRLETLPMVGTRIFVDLFDSSVKDANEAHIKSSFFKWSDEGADKATMYLQKNGFRVVVAIR